MGKPKFVIGNIVDRLVNPGYTPKKWVEGYIVIEPPKD